MSGWNQTNRRLMIISSAKTRCLSVFCAGVSHLVIGRFRRPVPECDSGESSDRAWSQLIARCPVLVSCLAYLPHERHSSNGIFVVTITLVVHTLC